MCLIAGKYDISNGFGTKRPQKTAPKSTRSMVANHTLGNCYESSHTHPMTLRVSSSGLPAAWDFLPFYTQANLLWAFHLQPGILPHGILC